MAKGEYYLVENKTITHKSTNSQYDRSFHISIYLIFFFLCLYFFILLIPSVLREEKFFSMSSKSEAEKLYHGEGDRWGKSTAISESTTNSAFPTKNITYEVTTKDRLLTTSNITSTVYSLNTTQKTLAETTKVMLANNSKISHFTDNDTTQLITKMLATVTVTPTKNEIYEKNSFTFASLTSPVTSEAISNKIIGVTAKGFTNKNNEINTESSLTSKSTDEIMATINNTQKTTISQIIENSETTASTEFTKNQIFTEENTTTIINNKNNETITKLLSLIPNNVMTATTHSTQKITIPEISTSTTFSKTTIGGMFSTNDISTLINPTTKLMKENTSNNISPSSCMTNLCKTESSIILSNMNHSFEYCQDFFEYACGGVRHKKAPLENSPEELVIRRIEDEINEVNEKRSISKDKLKIFYESCLNYSKTNLHQRLQKGEQILKSVGNMYIQREPVHNLTQVIANLIQLGSFPIFEISLDIHHNNPNKLALKMTIPLEDYLFSTENEREKRCKNVLSAVLEKNLKNFKLFMPLETVYNDYYQPCMENYSEYIKTIGEALSKFNVFTNKTQSMSQIQQVQMAVEQKLLLLYQKLPTPGMIHLISSTKIEPKFDVMTVEKLQSTFKVVDWKLLFAILLNHDISDETEVQVYFKSYFDDVFSILSDETELWKVHNALLAQLAHNIYKHFVKDGNPCDRENYCLKIMTRLVPDVTSNLFMSTFHKNKLKMHEKVIELYESVRRTLLEEVEDGGTVWLDKISSEEIKNKINSHKLVLPVTFVNTSINGQEFEMFPMESDYFSNAMKLIKRKNNLIYSMYSIDSNSPQAIWILFSKSFSSQSVYIYETNTLAIPEIILMKYNIDLPDAVNMARLGHEIARGFSHAFDNTGIFFNHKNNPECILTDFAYEMYKFMLNDADIFSYTHSHKEDGIFYNFKVLSKLTLNERLSDMSATKLALETLKRRGKKDPEVLPWGGLSKEQLYFVTLAQSFCSKKSVQNSFPDLFEKETLLPFLRVRSMFSNSEEFSLNFICPVGSEMNSEFKISPFPYLK
ncbi:endothelin-converting enzyme homolog [Lycorma delicatula]|uniref:endothelin-converting enzyme homolog n=1 Tax=Lycorma delicatula TaxID=130591 RepID=UPI003F519864